MKTFAALLFICACHTTPAPPPIERATPVTHEAPIDAAPEIVEAPPPDAAIEEAPPEKLSPIEQLPPSGENPLPENPSQAEIDERYALALQHANEPLGLALLLDIANAAGGLGPLDHTRYDDAWRSQWDNPAFAMIVSLEAPNAPDAEEDPTPPLACPKGTKAKHKGYVDWCQKPNGTKHGPYRYYEEGYDLDEGLATETGEYKDGKKEGLWYWSQSFDGWSHGGYVKGVRHGLWEEGDRDGYEYAAYVDGKVQGLVITKSAQGDDVTIGEHRYDRGVIDGPFREWQPSDPYALVLEGSYDHGKKTGAWTRHDEAGATRAIQHFDADLPDGEYTYFDDQGAVVVTGKMDHGTGPWAELDDSGWLAEGKLENGVKQGKWGERVGYGQDWETGEYKDGKRTGSWAGLTAYGGSTVWTGSFKAGLRDGEFRWFADGAQTGVGTFAKGKPTGRWELVDQNGTQTLDIKNGKLVKIDGKKPTKGEVEKFKTWSPENPSPIYELGVDEMY